MFGKDFYSKPYEDQTAQDFNLILEKVADPVPQNCPAKRHDKCYTTYNNYGLKNGRPQKSKADPTARPSMLLRLLKRKAWSS